jgi:xylose dehydrogenase (NAD/NADP)
MPIRIGSLGCGRIVARGLLPGMKDSKLAVLHALASERPGVAQEMAAKNGVPKAYDSYQALLDDPEVDAVYIPCTGELHKPWTLAAAKAGKHVLCEKPLALTVAEADEMVLGCLRAGVVLQEAFMWRHHPRSIAARKLVRDGVIGDLRLVNASFSFDIDRNDWRLKPERGGGAMWDVGCYGVNCARFFTGAEPTHVYSRAHWHPSGVDMSMQMALSFPGDVLANIDCSFEAPYRCRAEVVGTKGRIVLEDAFLPPGPMPILIARTPDQGKPLEAIEAPHANEYAAEIDDFCRSIQAGKLVDPAEDGVANMRALEWILETAQKQPR